MTLISYGINHKTAGLDLREQVAFVESAIPQALQSLRGRHAVNEAVLLSTCNRTEIYTDSSHLEAISDWLYTECQVDYQTLEQARYIHHDAEAIRHMMRVASGLDSMVLGEPQILGQMKQAYSLASEAGLVGPRFQTLFPAIFNTSKQVRSQTQIGAHPVSMAYAIVQLAKRIFSDLTQSKVLLIGAGETIELAAHHLVQSGIKQIIIANRSVNNAAAIAKLVGAKVISLAEIPHHLKEVDLLITATASELPILGKGMVESALKQRKHRPMIMADLAVPRDIETEVGELEDIYLYNVDDLQNILAENLSSRHDAAKHAELLISVQANHYLQQLRLLNSSEIIRDYRQQVENLRDRELTKALQQLQEQQSPEVVMAALAHNLSNKIMHKPTLKLRDAAYEGDLELLNLLKNFFKID